MVHPLEAAGNLAGLNGALFHDAQQRVASALAGELGMAAGELREAMQAGKSVEEMAAARGVSLEALQATAEGALREAVPGPLAARVPAMVRRLLHAHHHGAEAGPTALAPSSTFSARA